MNKYEVLSPFFHHSKNFEVGSQILLSEEEARGYGKALRPWPADKPDPEPPKEIAPSVYVSSKEESDAKISELQGEVNSAKDEITKLQEVITDDKKGDEKKSSKK